MMATAIKPRRPAAVTETAASAAPSSTLDDMTVEQYLELKFEEMLKDFRAHSDSLAVKLRKEYDEGVTSIQAMLSSTSSAAMEQVVVILKCIAGPHIGQRFRLETTNDGDDCFKMGRSTGKLFKEKGVSLYKDKEISTTHAKIELRNGQAFVIDMRSTNGSQLNREDLVAQTPYRLKDGDVITMGSTELLVHISDHPDVDSENTPASN